MIGFIQGTFLYREDEKLLVNVRGVGYELSCSQNTFDEVEGRDVVRLWVHTHVREDVLQLFGFSSRLEKQLFLSLIKVNGIGPKMALKILSSIKTQDLQMAIENEDVKTLTALPGIGKKTAEQVILSLRGKLVKLENSGAEKEFVARSEIVSALVNLGFRLTDVESVVSQMDYKTDLQQGVREGLSALTSQL